MPPRTLVIIVCLLFAIGCNNPGSPKLDKAYTYYDLEGMLEQQMVLLDSLNPTIDKTARIDSVTETRVLQLDSAAQWSRELEIFFQADINAPVLRGSYRISEQENGALKIRSFEAIDPEKAGVEYLKVHFYQDAVQMVEAFYKEKNALYNSQRIMILSFQQPAGQTTPLLDSYEIKGKHKMIMKDPVTFQIIGKLAY